MTEEQRAPPELIPPRMTTRLPTLASSSSSMGDGGCLELVWENGEIVIRGPSTEKSKYYRREQGETSANNIRSNKDDVGVLRDSMMLGDYPLLMSGLSSSALSKLDKNNNNNKIINSVLSELYEEDGFNVVPEPETARSCYDDDDVDDHSHVVPVNKSFRPSYKTTNGANSGTREKEGNFMPISEPKTDSPEAIGLGPSPSSLAAGIGNRKCKLCHDDDDDDDDDDDEQMVPSSSSVSSRGASNSPTYTFTTRSSYRDEHTTTDLSDQIAMEGTTKEEVPARGSKGTNNKRKRKTEVHNLSERRRRDKINKKMRALQDLIPNCNKVDKASMLDEAIHYLKNLKLQVQMMMSMGMGSGFCMPPIPIPIPNPMNMMLPSAMQQHLGGYSPMAMSVGMMGMRMQMGLGLGCGPGAQFPTASVMLPGNGNGMITEPSGLNNNMVGCFPAAPHTHMLLMSPSPFLSLPATGRFPPQFVHTTPGPSPGHGPAYASAQVEIPATSN